MQKKIVIIMSLFIIISAISIGNAEEKERFNPADYSLDELRDIQRAIESYLAKERDNFAFYQSPGYISAGVMCSVGLKTDGTVVVAGDIECDISDWNNIISIRANPDGFFILGLKSDGTVVTTNTYYTQGVENWTDIIAISAGKNHALGLKKDGTVVAAGDDNNE